MPAAGLLHVPGMHLLDIACSCVMLVRLGNAMQPRCVLLFFFACVLLVWDCAREQGVLVCCLYTVQCVACILYSVLLVYSTVCCLCTEQWGGGCK